VIKHIHISGLGTVGSRVADVVASIPGYEISGSKRSITDGDPRTVDFLRIHKARGGFPVYLPPSSGQFAQKRFRLAGVEASLRDTLDPRSIDLVLDCTDGKVGDTPIPQMLYNTFYKPNNLPFAIQGGGPADLVSNNFYVGIPRISEPLGSLSNAKIVSCNSTATTYVLALATQALLDIGVRPEFIPAIALTMKRRYGDPDTQKVLQAAELVARGGVPPSFFDNVPYHMEEIRALNPELGPQLDTTKGVELAAHFHSLDFSFFLKPGVKGEFLPAFIEHARNHPWVIFNNGGRVDQKVAVAVAEKVGLGNGDFPFPVLSIGESTNEQLVKIFALNPMRGVTATSSAVYAVQRLEDLSTQAAFERVHQTGSFRGKPLHNLAEIVEQELRGEELAA
jgi:hypothetical protein